MNVTLRVTVDADLASLAKVLTLGDLPDRPRPAQIRAAAGAVLARYPPRLVHDPCPPGVPAAKTTPPSTAPGVRRAGH